MPPRPHAFAPILAILAALLLIAPPARAATTRASVSATLSTSALQPGQQGVIAVVIDLNEGFHAQSHTPLDANLVPLTVTPKGQPHLTFYDPIYPDPQVANLAALNARASIYSGEVVIYVPIAVDADAPTGPIEITGAAHMQICDNNSCFAPQTIPFTVKTSIVAKGEPVTQNQADVFKAFDPRIFAKLKPPGGAVPTTPPSPSTAPAQSASPGNGSFTVFGIVIGHDSFALAFIAAFLIGIIFNVMPCVLPVLPLKAIGFYEVSQHHRARAFAFGVAFSLGIVATFAALAVLVLIGHSQWGQLWSRGWFVYTIAAVLVVAALGMFGLFSIRLPTSLYALEPRHDSYTGNFLYGILAALLSTPCTAPIFPLLLAWAASHTTAIGITVLLMVGVGMAAPYLVLSALPELARKLPRGGPWSEIIKQSMAFLLIAVAGYLLGARWWPGTAQFMWIVLGVCVAGGIFVITRTRQLMPRPRPVLIATLAALLVCAGTLAIALAVNRPGNPSDELTWQPYTAEALQGDRATHIVLVDFTANWCLNCKYVEATVFTNAKVRAALERNHVELLRADLTREDAPGWELLSQLNSANGIPLTAIYVPGQERPKQLTSIYTPATLLETLDEIGTPATRPAANATELTGQGRLLDSLRNGANVALCTIKEVTPIDSERRRWLHTGRIALDVHEWLRGSGKDRLTLPYFYIREGVPIFLQPLPVWPPVESLPKGQWVLCIFKAGATERMVPPVAGADGAAWQVWTVSDADDPVIAAMKQVIAMDRDKAAAGWKQKLAAGLGDAEPLVRQYCLDALARDIGPTDPEAAMALLAEHLGQAGRTHPGPMEGLTTVEHIEMLASEAKGPPLPGQAIRAFAQAASSMNVDDRLRRFTLQCLAKIVVLPSAPSAAETFSEQEREQIRNGMEHLPAADDTARAEKATVFKWLSPTGQK